MEKSGEPGRDIRSVLATVAFEPGELDEQLQQAFAPAESVIDLPGIDPWRAVRVRMN